MSPPTDERRDTYDSRRIDGLVSALATLTERVDNMKEIMRDQAAAARSLRNGIYVGSFVFLLTTAANLFVVPHG